MRHDRFDKALDAAMHTVGEKPPAHIVEAGKDKAAGEGAAEGAAGGPATIASPGGVRRHPRLACPGKLAGRVRARYRRRRQVAA